MYLMLIRIWKKNYDNDKRRIPTYHLAYLLTLVVKELLRIHIEHGRVVPTLYIIKH